MIQGRHILAKVTPAGLVDQATRRSQLWWQRTRQQLAEFDRQRVQAEAELRRQYDLSDEQSMVVAVAESPDPWPPPRGGERP
jgi:hypothetical protein